MELSAPASLSDQRQLRRSFEGRMVAGVAAGVARYFDVDVVVVRIALVALTLMAGIGVPLYAAAWLLVPDEESELSVADHLLGHFQVAMTHRSEGGADVGRSERSGHGL
jgi:phage shock protein PspC (stress-responsive transcriptional regulator)